MGTLQLHGIGKASAGFSVWGRGRVEWSTRQAAAAVVDPDCRPSLFGGVSHAGHQLDWVYSSRSMDNGVCRLYCRSNQRRGGAQHALCRACGSVWEGVLFVTSPTWSAVLSPPLLSVYACCLLASFLLSFFLPRPPSSYIPLRESKFQKPRFLAYSLELP